MSCLNKNVPENEGLAAEEKGKTNLSDAKE